MKCDFPPHTESVAALRPWLLPSVLARRAGETFASLSVPAAIGAPAAPTDLAHSDVCSGFFFSIFFFCPTPQHVITTTLLPVPFSGTFTQIWLLGFDTRESDDVERSGEGSRRFLKIAPC